MKNYVMLATALVLGLTAGAMAQTVTVSLDSSADGQTVSPGATIDWTISFTVSTGDNEGLALLICDLQQDDANPAKFDLSPASNVPAAMGNFSRPNGISNPGETDPTTGYIGVQRGDTGSMDLVQIGGAQNTFGEALASGTGIGENAVVAGGVGQSGSVILAEGSFTAPTTAGTYTFSLANGMANVLTQVSTPPTFSPVVEATVDTTAGTFSFEVGAGVDGDLDGDGDVDLADLQLLLAAYGSSTGDGNYNANADFDDDGDVDLTDLQFLLANYGTGA